MLDRVLSLDDTNISAWETKGHVLTQIFRYREAVAAFNQALAIDPNCPQGLSGYQFARKKMTGVKAGSSLGEMLFRRQVLVQWGALMLLIVIAIVTFPALITYGYSVFLPVSLGPQHPTMAMNAPDICTANPDGGFYKETLIDPVPFGQRMGDWNYTHKPVSRSTVIGKVALVKSYLPIPPGECSPFDVTVVNGELLDKTIFKNIALKQDGRQVIYTSSLPQTSTQLGHAYIYNHMRTYRLIVADATTQNIILGLSVGDTVIITGYEVEASGTGPNGAKRFEFSNPGSPDKFQVASELTYINSVRVLPCQGKP